MFKKSRVGLAAAMAVGGLSVPATSALAQEGQRVEVTGSRIATPGAESPSPLQVITAQEIANSGVINIQDLLGKNPTTGQATFSRTNSNFDTSNSGVSTIDLRNLGVARTLVLVNGKRFVAGIPGSSAVDLNSIPTDFIERIELLTGGASSTYGSDAVAGVVNIILKREFEGLTVDVSTGRSKEGDDHRNKASLTWGSNVAGGKGNVMAYLGYTREGTVMARDRGLGTDDISNAAFTGEVKDLFSLTTPFFSSFAPQGRIFLNPGGTPNPSVTFDANGNVIPFSTNGPNGDGVGATGFNRQQFRAIAIPTERYLMAAKGDYEFLPGHRAFMEGTYSSTSTESTLEPFPLQASGLNGIYPGTNRVPADFLVNGVLTRNPVVPDGIYNLLTPDPVDGVRYYDFTRRLSEVGNRGNNAELDTFRGLTGVRGNIVSSWDYELYGAYGHSKRSQVSGGQVNVLNFRNALEAIPDGAGGAQCRDADARAQGCVPISIFGFNSITPEALRYIIAPTLLSTKVTQEFVGGTVTGEPLTAPAGPIGFAAGFEYRKETSRSEFDPLAQAGLNAGNAIPATFGEFDVKEFFAEARVPIVKDAPFAKSIALSGAFRTGDYSTVGNTMSWNAGGEWAVNSQFKVRATRALSTRAPNINELFQPPTQNFPAVSDPCEGVTATSVGQRDNDCRSDPGVAANIAQNGSFTLNQADLQGTSGFDRGNPNLEEEKGWSTTIGLVITPAALERFAFTFDWFDIKVDQAIVPTDRQFLLNQCYGGDRSFCQFVQRNPTAIGANSAGFLQRVDTAVTNSGGISTSGWDITGTYSDRLGPGRLSGRLAWTHLISGYTIPQPGADRNNFAGEIGAAKNRGSLGLGYSWGGWGINGMLTFIGKSDVDDQILATLCSVPLDANGNCASPAQKGSATFEAKTYLDAQLSYTMGKVQYYFGIDNLLDTKAPRLDTNNVFGIGSFNGAFQTGVGTVADVYDPIGRRFYVGLRMSL